MKKSTFLSTVNVGVIKYKIISSLLEQLIMTNNGYSTLIIEKDFLRYDDDSYVYVWE